MVLVLRTLLILVLLATGFATPARAAQDIVIGGGAVTGLYYEVARQSCALVNKYAKDKYNCVGRPALGSVFNVNAVDRRLLDFGVAQSDVNWQATHGKGDWDGKPVVTLRSVFGVHPEAVLLMARADAGIRTVSDLRGKRVNIGNPGSGQRGNAEDVLKVYGLDMDRDIRVETLQQTEASRALIDKRIDAFFYTVGNPSAAIEEPANAIPAHLVPLNGVPLREFLKDKPYYVPAIIPANTYRGTAVPIETYAVKGTLVASSEASETMVYDFTRTIFENLDEFKAANTAFRTLQPKEMLQGLSAPFHPGAARYYRERGWL